MKKRIILALVLMFGVLGAKAQDWRAIIELHAGIQPGRTDVKFPTCTLERFWNPLSFGLNYSMGAMVIPQLFAGVGIGGYTALTDDGTVPSLYFPIFANARWILNKENKINPYVDVKIGYQMGVDLENSYYQELYFNDSWHDVDILHKNGIFFQPGIGVRFGRDSAFNLGIAYNFTLGRKFILDRGYHSSKTYGLFMLTFGTDF